MQLDQMMPYENQSYWVRRHAQNGGSLSAVGYSGMGDGFNRVTYRLRKAAAARILKRHPEIARSSLLEAAVGIGTYGDVWAGLGVRRWVGVDICERAVRDCRSAYPDHLFVVGDLTDTAWLPDPAKKFDLVTAIDVLYHLVDEDSFQSAVGNLAGCVRPGGGLLVSDVFVKQDRQIAPHVRRRSLETYRRALGPSTVLLDREPVFSLLADPVLQTPRQPGQYALWTAWRLIARAVTLTPALLRNPAGAALAVGAWPLDALFRKTGMSAHFNLELALFQKSQ